MGAKTNISASGQAMGQRTGPSSVACRHRALAIGTLLVVLTVIAPVMTYDASGADQQPKAGRWAVVPVREDDRAVGDLISAELSKVDGLELVERADIDKIIKEKELSAAGLVRPESRMQIGKLLSAEALVLVASRAPAPANGQRPQDEGHAPSVTRIRVVETRSGIRVLDVVISSSPTTEELAGAMAQLVRARETLRRPAAARHYLGILGFTSEDLGTEEDSNIRALNVLVESELGRLSDVIVMERSDLDQLRKESDLSGIELELRTSTRLVQGGLKRDGRQMKISLNIAPLGGGEARLINATSRSSDLSDLRHAIVEAIAKALGERIEPSAPSDPELEAEQFSQQGEWLRSQFRFADAAPMFDAAYALAPCVRYAFSAHHSRFFGAAPHSLEQGRAVLAFAQYDLESLRRWLIEHPDGDGYSLKRLMIFWYADGKDRDYVRNWRSSHNMRKEELPRGWHPMQTDAEARRLEAQVYEVYRQKVALLAASLRGQGISALPLYASSLNGAILPVDDEGRIKLFEEVFAHLDEEVRAGITRPTFDDPAYSNFQTSLFVWDRLNNYRPEWLKVIERNAALKNRVAKFLLSQKDPLLRMHGYKYQEDPNVVLGRQLLDQLLLEAPLDAVPIRHNVMTGELLDDFTRSVFERLGKEGLVEDYFEALLQRAKVEHKAVALARNYVLLNQLLGARESYQYRLKSEDLRPLRLRRVDELLAAEHLTPDQQKTVDKFHLAMTGKLPVEQHVFPYVPPKPPRLPKPPAPDDPWPRYTWERIPFVHGAAKGYAPFKVIIDHEARLVRGHDEFVVFWFPLPLIGGQIREVLITRLRKPGAQLEVVGRHDFAAEPAGTFVVSPDAVYVLSSGNAIQEYAAGRRRTITLDPPIPMRQLRTMAWLDGRIYFGLDAKEAGIEGKGATRDYLGAVGRLDPATGKIDLIASSKSAVVRHGLDHCDPYGVSQMKPDARGKCLWLTVVQESGPAAQKGLWKYTPATGQLQQVMHGALWTVAGAHGLLVGEAVSEYESEMTAWSQVDYNSITPRRLGLHRDAEWISMSDRLRDIAPAAIESYQAAGYGEFIDSWERHFSKPRYAPPLGIQDYFEEGLLATSGNQPNWKFWYIHPRTTPALVPVSVTTAEPQEVKPQASQAEVAKVSAALINSIGMKFTLIPAGEFQMGSPLREPGRTKNEQQHHVRITRPFYLGLYAVTQAEYERVTKKNPSVFSATGSAKEQVAGKNTSRFPVECVSWADAQEFCRRLSQLEGKTYRLPTEAEWEYACRAGTTTAFNVGNTLSTEQANIDFELGRTTTVGSYAPNAFGLCDMHGNVSQWCSDYCDETYYAKSPADDPTGPAAGAFHVYRGGSWYFEAAACRSAFRGCGVNAYVYVGIRVVREQ